MLSDGSEHYDCSKIIHFDFPYYYYGYEDSYDSYSCFNFVKGEPYGYTEITYDGYLYLDGTYGFVSVSQSFATLC